MLLILGEDINQQNVVTVIVKQETHKIEKINKKKKRKKHTNLTWFG